MNGRTAARDAGSTASPPDREIAARTPAELLGDEVRAFREHRGLSLSQVAGLVFASKSLISAIEHGHRTGTSRLIAAVDAVLEATGRIEALWPAAAASRRGPGRPSSCPTCQRRLRDIGSGRVGSASSPTGDLECPGLAEEIGAGVAMQAVALAERALGRCGTSGEFVARTVPIGGRADRRPAAPRVPGLAARASRRRLEHTRVYQGDRRKAPAHAPVRP